jgi:hypothetical protein
MRAEEVKIQAVISDYQNLTRPTAAFITFESDNGYQLALDLAAENEKLPDEEEKKIMDQHIRFVEASEPTDIIWENRHHTAKDYTVR